MTEQTPELMQRLVVGHKRDGRCCYDRQAKRELIEASLQPGVSVAKLALMHGINASVAAQRDSVGQVHAAVGALDQMTLQNAALVEQSAAAASSMHQQSEQLRGLVQRFHLADVAYALPAVQPTLRLA